MTDLGVVVDGFAERSVLVVGDAMLDVYLEGGVSRLCREAPVPLVQVDRRADVPGGAANTAVNLAALGASVCLLAPVGVDDDAARLRSSLEAARVDCTDLVADDGRETLALTRIVASSQLLVRFDRGSTDAPGADAEAALVARLRARWADADAVVVSDYGHGTLTPAVLEALAELQAGEPRTLIVDSKQPAAFRDLAPTAVKPNWGEVRDLLGDGLPDDVVHRADAIADRGDEILARTGARIAAVTLDIEGALVVERGAEPYRTYASPSPDVLATGAGDTYISVLALALAGGAATPVAAELAAAAAGIVVRKSGTAVCGAPELRRVVTGHDKVLTGPGELAAVAEEHRRRGRRIVFTNGCFDILHQGHVSYLKRAKLLGDVLVVAVNDDESVRLLKGEQRPINSLDDRLRVLAALGCIDHLVAFGGESPTTLLEAARPDVFAKGGDYTLETLPEAPMVEALGGEVALLPIEPDRSTTRIIERVQAQVVVP